MLDRVTGFYEDQVLPRAIDVLLGTKPFGKLRARAVAGLHGEVLEVGFGSGLNLPHYPPEVTRVLAVDPAQVGQQLAAKRLAASPVPVDFIGLDGEHLPLPDASVDSALSTFTLCTIPDVAQALGEIRRVLKPGGVLHVLEHGLSPDAKVARWQHRLDPIQQRVAGGCHLTRPIDELLAGAGFDPVELNRFYVKGPKFAGYLYAGTATNP